MALIEGFATDDSLNGTSDADEIFGYAGNDTIYGSDGADSIDGGADFDMVDYSASADAVTVNLADGTGSGGDAEGDEYVSIEDVTGSDHNDAITGNDEANYLYGGNGDDTLTGGLGADILTGGDGSDVADYSASNAAVTVDLLSGTGTGGHADGDALFSIETVIGSAFNDVLIGDGNTNRLDGGDGDDTFAGDDGADALIGGAGVDTALFYLSDAAVSINLNAGTGTGGEAQGDTFSGIESLVATAFNDSLVGDSANNQFDAGAGNDTLIGNGGNDTLNGGDNDDWIDGGIGNDVIDGGTGINTVNYSGAASFVTVNLTTTNTSGVYGNDTVTNIQNIIGSAFNDSLTGSSTDNVLIGGAGNDTLVGAGGTDTVDYSASSGAMVINLTLQTGRNNNSAAGGNSTTELDSILTAENIIGTSFNDSLVGNTANNILTGGDGNDSLGGGDGLDTIYGGSGTDVMSGGNGDDTYYVDATNDIVNESTSGGLADRGYASASFTLDLNIEQLILTGTGDLNGTGSNGANAITGTSGNNSLDGGAGNDTIIAGEGNDILNGGNNIDSLTGGDGDDIYYVNDALDVIVENADEGHDTVNSVGAWTLGETFEDLTIIGSGSVAATGNSVDNLIRGSNGNNLLTGLGGDDTLIGDYPADTLLGGNDTLDGGDGINALFGGRGDDTYLVTTGTDTIVELSNQGTDLVRSAIDITLVDNVENLILTGVGDTTGTGNGLVNVLTGNDGNNALYGGGDTDTLIGGIGDDVLNGGAGIDSMSGGAGSDDYYVDDSGDLAVDGLTAGTDSVYTSVSYALHATIEQIFALGNDAIDLTGNSLANLLEGNNNDNSFLGGNLDDTLIGFAGNDTLNGEVGNDSMEGGEGDDVYIVNVLTDLTVELEDEGTDEVRASVDWTIGDHIDNLVLTGTAKIGTGNGLANEITGTSAANSLFGLDGTDTLIGDAGNDSLNGGAGIDTMIGGLGNDTYTINTLADVLTEAADEGVDLVKSALTYSLGDNLDNLTLLGTNDVDGTGNLLANLLTGNTGANLLTGDDGDDTLIGGAGDDTMDGGLGADLMKGAAGADLYLVDNSGDVVVEVSTVGVDRVISSVSYTLANYIEILELSDGTIDGTGNSIANTILGTISDNVLSGLGGNDILNGFAGSDTLNGGIGNDTMNGGNGNDVYVVNALGDVVTELGTGVDRVESAVTYTLGATLEHLTLTGVNKINATGNATGNTIIGNSNINRITGLEGNDNLTGGTGADRFVFTSITSGLDTITDFNGLVSGIAEGDKFEFAASLLVGVFDYVGSAAFSGGSDNSEARVNTLTGRLLVDTDGDGTADITMALTGLVNANQLVLADFVFA